MRTEVVAMSVSQLGLLLVVVAGVVLVTCAAFGAYAGRRGVNRRKFDGAVRALAAGRATADRERRELAAILERVRLDAQDRRAAEAAADRRIRHLQGQVADLHRSLLALQSQVAHRPTGESAPFHDSVAS
jgi:uncharacterized Ntn-hydrolase superfamily protein